MESLYSALGQFFSKMNQCPVTHPLYKLLTDIGLIGLGHSIFFLWDQFHPTPQMLRDRKFFSIHKRELNEVYNLLEDDRSKEVFENVLKFRAYRKGKYIKTARGIDDPETQYFVQEIQFLDREVIVDCGAYTGDTTEKFYAASPGCIVIGLEPDDKNYQQLSSLQHDRLVTYKCGVWSEDSTLMFSDEGGGRDDGKVAEDGNIKIVVRALDHIPECQGATYIKMDIEGAELEALKGAENIIKRNRPKLAICIYHKPQDLFEIPFYIKELNPEYKFYIHHHTWDVFDTVLYAV